jgi:hypothetical protein
MQFRFLTDKLGFFTLPLTPPKSKSKEASGGKKPLGWHRCYHHIGMRSHTIGRTLGIGLRIAGRMVGQRVSARAQASASAPARQPATAFASREPERAAEKAAGPSRGQAAGWTIRGFVRGVGAFLRPFCRVGGILWLEVTGVFFFLPVLVFAPNLWRLRPSHLLGPYDKTFLITAAVMVVFFYLSVSSFWRARKR